jgi:hypothetical protein
VCVAIDFGWQETLSEDAANSPTASHHHHSPNNNNNNGDEQIHRLEAMLAEAWRVREHALNHPLQEVSNIQYERANFFFQ